jgi:glycosyltransferase involved in cell wall biosynthesis
MTVHERDAPPRSANKLLTVSHYFETHRGGIEIVASSLAQELANRGIDVTWMAADASPVSATTENVTRIALRASNLLERTIGIPYPLAYPSAWRRIFRETKPADAVLIHDGLYLTSVIAALSASWAGKPYIVVQHIGMVPYNNVLLRTLMSVANKVITRTVLKHADQIVFISEVTQRYFAGLECRRLPRLIFNGLDTNVFNPPGNDIEAIEARQHFDLPPSGPIALFVGRFVEKKGLATLRSLAREHPGIIFAFAGWGAIDPCKWNLANVRVFTSLSGATLASLYRASSILVLPSAGEGFPLVIQEALACGLPVLCGLETASADSSACTFVTGAPVDPSDPERTAQLFSQQMARLLAKPNTTAERTKRFEFARAHYSSASSVEQYANILRELIANKPRRQRSLPLTLT